MYPEIREALNIFNKLFQGGENGVEMSYMHNNNTGSDDNTLPHPRKNGPTNRQYV